MNVLVAAEVRFDRTPDGAVWTQTVFDRQFWSRYLDAFDGVRVLARVRDVAHVPDGWRRVDGGGVNTVPVPHYHGPWQYLARRRDVIAAAQAAARNQDAILLRIPSVLASVLHPYLRRQRRPFAVEVLGDPYEAFSPGAIKHPLRPFLRVWLASQLRAHCGDAIGAAYVTREVLQRLYPAAPDAMSTHYSSLDLEQAVFAATPRTYGQRPAAPVLVGVGSLAQLYKGPDVVIEAVRILARAGADVRLVWVGDGAHRASLEQRARALRLADRIRFVGELMPGEPVRAELDRADLFVMPSRSEGLPRAMIEAMARGLPCIGSRVGGIPELLTPEDMVPPDDPAALAAAVHRVLIDPERMGRMSRRNLAKASEYRSEVLKARRVALYRFLRHKTAAWAEAAETVSGEPVALA